MLTPAVKSPVRAARFAEMERGSKEVGGGANALELAPIAYKSGLPAPRSCMLLTCVIRGLGIKGEPELEALSRAFEYVYEARA